MYKTLISTLPAHLKNSKSRNNVSLRLLLQITLVDIILIKPRTSFIVYFHIMNNLHSTLTFLYYYLDHYFISNSSCSFFICYYLELYLFFQERMLLSPPVVTHACTCYWISILPLLLSVNSQVLLLTSICHLCTPSRQQRVPDSEHDL